MLPASVDDHLDLFFEGVNAVIRKSPDDYTADDVLSACRSGRAVFFVGDEEFFVLEPVFDSKTKERTLHLWIAYSRRNRGSFHRYTLFIEVKAKEVGATKVTMKSKRKAYQRLIPHYLREKDQENYLYERCF